MRKKIVAGNWKMNHTLPQTLAFIETVKKNPPQTSARVMIAPAFPNLYAAVEALRNYRVEVIAQNVHEQESGAYTGEVSASMLTSIGVQTVIIGHSERRIYYKETDALLAAKVATALQHGMKVIFCFGEELAERKAGNHFQVVETQLKNGLFQRPAEDWQRLILAYEPVWAIGTGETATPAQAQEMHRFIRQTLAQQYGEPLAQSVSILYGGSVKPSNATDIFSQPDVDGGLIGGASLLAEDFAAIVSASH